MNSTFSRLLAFFSLLATLTVGQLASADSAQAYLKTKQEELVKLIQAGSNENNSKLISAFDGLLDYQSLASASLGTEWDKLAEADRTRFVDSLRTLVRRSYTKNIRDTLNYRIDFNGEEPAKSGGTVVHTKAVHKTNANASPLAIDYVVKSSGGKWQVIDIITEQSSMVANYRSQFRKIIQKEGFSALLAKMQKKIDSGAKD